MGLLGWLRGDVDALEAAKREAPTETPEAPHEPSKTRDLHEDLVRDFDLPADAQTLTFDVEVETKSRTGDSALEAAQPRMRQEGDRFVVDIDFPGLREETLAVDRGESETLVRGEQAPGPFIVRLRPTPPGREDDVDVRARDDLLTISFPAPVR